MSDSAILYTTGSVTSAGTTIGYPQIGSGPGLLFLHGGLQASQHYMRLATALSDAFTVYVPDRRGRGLSGPPGDQYSMAKGCKDVDGSPSFRVICRDAIYRVRVGECRHRRTR
ncbi:MAG TPA: alpha/beta hydrolase [Ktedonobacteraceae bacterium]|nr:alpha/beta hydrolase [Ktedonobacteraceae bacterium]